MFLHFHAGMPTPRPLINLESAGMPTPRTLTNLESKWDSHWWATLFKTPHLNVGALRQGVHVDQSPNLGA